MVDDWAEKHSAKAKRLASVTFARPPACHQGVMREPSHTGRARTRFFWWRSDKWGRYTNCALQLDGRERWIGVVGTCVGQWAHTQEGAQSRER